MCLCRGLVLQNYFPSIKAFFALFTMAAILQSWRAETRKSVYNALGVGRDFMRTLCALSSIKNCFLIYLAISLIGEKGCYLSFLFDLTLQFA